MREDIQNMTVDQGYNLTDRKTTKANLDRLVMIQGSDPGIFVLAVHSFIEGWMRSHIEREYEDGDQFSDFLADLRRMILARSPEISLARLNVLNLLRYSHHETNFVRHQFITLSVEDARIATEHLVKFCSLVDIKEAEPLQKIEEYLDAWKIRQPLGEIAKSLSEAGYRVQIERNRIKKLTLEAEKVQELEEKVESLSGELAEERKRVEGLSKARGTLDDLKEKHDEVRRNAFKINEDLKHAKRQLSELKEAKKYLEILTRMTVYTRTRSDYERTITRLTQEQKRVLERISLNEDFLIKGAAGTGKTLVLLKAIEKVRSGNIGQSTLNLSEIRETIALLTYTKTLVKYDQYVASLLMDESVGAHVSTADHFLQERFREIKPGHKIDYWIVDGLAKDYPVAGLSAKELAAEVESFIWGNDVSYEEYVLEGIERRGMKRPLNKEQRNSVWCSAVAMETKMAEGRVWSRNRAALEVSRLTSGGEGKRVTSTDFIFVDEAQDLSAAILKALKACARSALILSGDSDQSIYQPGFSFKRAGIEIAGRTRILRTNFRNTLQIHEVSERYRLASMDVDVDNQPEAFREGPAPEIFECADIEEMLSVLEKRIGIFMNALGYEPENLCVIVPHGDDINNVKSSLSRKGWSFADIRDEGFDFDKKGSIRITTMHSAKGLDFPVVLIFLPRFHVINTTLDPATSDRMARNLLYVAMTRAMDHLNVIIKEKTENSAVTDLAACFKM